MMLRSVDKSTLMKILTISHLQYNCGYLYQCAICLVEIEAY